MSRIRAARCDTRHDHFKQLVCIGRIEAYVSVSAGGLGLSFSFLVCAKVGLAVSYSSFVRDSFHAIL